MNDEDEPPVPATRARDHMANERTYLAWVRTALAVMALGVAIAGFANDVSWQTASAGSILVVVGAAGIGYGTRRYRQVTRELEAGRYVTGTRGRGPVIAAAVLIAGLVLALLLILLGRS